MSMMESKGALSKATKELFEKWNQAKEIWTDAQSRDFEKNFLVQIEQDVRSAFSALDRMDSVIQKIRTDCE